MTAYPEWICVDCGLADGRSFVTSSSTFHMKTCGWCGDETAVTSPRDFGWPPAPKSKRGGVLADASPSFAPASAIASLSPEETRFA